MSRLVRQVALLAVALSLVGCKSKTAPKAAAPVEPAFRVKAGDLLTEYSTNAVAADAKYKGQVLLVTGQFHSANKAPLLGYAVQLAPEGGGDVGTTFVQCFIVESAEAKVAAFQPGQKIALVGTCDGQVLGQVKLSKCSLAE
ncbi:MAG TPA: hypothetical protein VFE78_40300 [Gemmataceae bacterium]|jgi:hypothetical protein|nr:hypothetical protein [Gemmataceae bacterium]